MRHRPECGYEFDVEWSHDMIQTSSFPRPLAAQPEYGGSAACCNLSRKQVKITTKTCRRQIDNSRLPPYVSISQSWWLYSVHLKAPPTPRSPNMSVEGGLKRGNYLEMSLCIFCTWGGCKLKKNNNHYYMCTRWVIKMSYLRIHATDGTNSRGDSLFISLFIFVSYAVRITNLINNAFL